MTTPALPPGFEPDAPSAAPALPPGFTADAPAPATPRRGAAAIPTAAEEAGKPYVAPAGAAAAPPRPPSFADKVTGAVQSALDLVSNVVGGGLGMAGGAVQSLGENIGEKAAQVVTIADRARRGVSLDNLPKSDLPTLDQRMGQGAELGTKLLRDIPLGENGAPVQTNAVGQAINEGVVEPLMQNLLPAMPLHGTMGPAGAAKPALRAANDVRRGTVAPVARAGAEAAADAAAPIVQKVAGIDPELVKVARSAQDLKYPIDVRPDQIVENAKFSKLAGQAAADVPIANSKKVSNQVAFTRNLIDMLNPEETKADRLTPDVFEAAMQRSGKGIGDIYARTPTPIETMTPKLDALREQADKFATDNDKRIIGNYIDELQSKADENGVIDGTALREFNSELGARARSEVDNDLGNRLNQLQDIIAKGVQKSITDPADASALRDFNRQYAYGKLVEPLVAKTIDGKVSPASLMARVTATKSGKIYMSRGNGGPIGELAKVGQLIKEPGSSGTAERSMVYQALMDSGKAASAVATYPLALGYNTAGPAITRMLTRRAAKKGAPEAPAAPELTAGQTPFEPQDRGGAPASPLGDLTPDWETTPGAGRAGEAGVDATGLVPAVDEVSSSTVRSGKRAGEQIPAVPGRPDLPDTMIAGEPREVGRDARTGEAMLSDNAALAREQQRNRGGDDGAAPPANDGGGGSGGGDGGAPRHPRLDEIDRLKAQTSSPEVHKALDAEAKKIEAESAKTEAYVKRRQDAGELRRAADETDDIELKTALRKRAAALEEPVPVGEVKEGQPPIKIEKPGKIPVGKAIEITPEYIEADKAWRKEHGLGADDAQRAKDVHRALAFDEDAVHAAVRQHERSPVAFDREIARIIDQGETRANETKQAAQRSPGDAARDVAGDADAATNAKGNEPAGAVHAGIERAGADSAAAPGRGSGEARASGGQAQGGGKSSGVEIREVPGGFEAWKDGKKVGYLKDNLERGQAKQLDENANIDIVKVDKDMQGTGVGRALYQAFNDKHEGRIAPSGKTTPDAWKQWKRNYPEKVEDFVQQEAQRIREGADQRMVVGNITDPEVAQRVVSALNDKGPPRGTDTKPNDQPGGVRQEARAQDAPEGRTDGAKGASDEEVFDAGQAAQKPAGSPEVMRAALVDKFGERLIAGLEEKGLLKLIRSDEHPLSAQHEGIRAMVNRKTGEASILVDRVSPADAPAKLMHELGEHFGMPRLLGEERYGVMLNELKALKDDPAVRDVWQQAEKDYFSPQYPGKKMTGRDDPRFLSEVAARLVEGHPDLPFVRRLINEVRAYFYEHFGTTMGNRVDANLVRGLAASALRKAAAGELKPPVRMLDPKPVPSTRSAPAGAVARPLQ